MANQTETGLLGFGNCFVVGWRGFEVVFIVEANLVTSFLTRTGLF